MQSDSETTTRSTLESPVIGLIENSTAYLPNTDMPGTSNEPNPEASKLTPAVTEGISSATRSCCSSSTFPVYATIYPGGIG